MIDRRFSVAPMLDWTDRHCRYFLRLISKRALLYTEMITTAALLHRPPAHFLDHDPSEQPLALQLGGSDPEELANCAELAARWGFAEINLNLGCPSDRVQSGRFGACLMAEPTLVSDCIRAMTGRIAIPVTAKHRIGIDDLDSYQMLCDFVGSLANAGCAAFIIHARKAWLKGLSPKENREIPPLDYDRVYRLKTDFPDLEIVINGGITTLDAAEAHLRRVDGVMMGREAYHNPWILAEVDRRLYGDPDRGPSRPEVVDRLVTYLQREAARGTPPKRITRHILGLYRGQPGSRAWRRQLSNQRDPLLREVITALKAP
ncbi:MAG: tRNA dihydrouridine(20/20a) synthase DusA [Gammaproteobacteria bacterium]|nr:tRNA dihydrouridine(20/20a) synthase DusA [Gammaproteobacteria bacterium]